MTFHPETFNAFTYAVARRCHPTDIYIARL